MVKDKKVCYFLIETIHLYDTILPYTKVTIEFHN